MKSLTIFTIPKTFGGLQDPTRITQDNAIISWLNLKPRPDIILFGNDSGVCEAAERFGCKYHPTILKTPLGTPLVSEAFKYVGTLTDADLTAYVNCDIIISQLWLDGILLVEDQIPDGPFVIVGQRWDVLIDQAMNYNCNWADRLNVKAKHEGRRHGSGGSDIVSLDIPLVDLSQYAMVFHQGILPMRRCDDNVEDRINVALYNDNKGTAIGNISDATHYLSKTGELHSR